MPTTFLCEGAEMGERPTRIPVIAVIGYKESGKTTVIEGLTSRLTERGYSVATAKHIDQKGFRIDKEGKDTWRHAASGANPVIAVSDVETAVIHRRGLGALNLRSLLGLIPKADLLILEGFSKIVLGDKHIGKIVCVRTLREYEDFRRRIRGEALAFCSLKTLGEPILSVKENLPTLTERAIEYVERRKSILEILDSLPNLDCGKCQYRRCECLAEAIHDGRAKLDDCVLIKVRPKLKTRITLNGVEVHINPFISEIVRRSVLGMISTLKGVEIRGDETLQIEISQKK